MIKAEVTAKAIDVNYNYGFSYSIVDMVGPIKKNVWKMPGRVSIFYKYSGDLVFFSPCCDTVCHALTRRVPFFHNHVLGLVGTGLQQNSKYSGHLKNLIVGIVGSRVVGLLEKKYKYVILKFN
jgi:hypothetical protein